MPAIFLAVPSLLPVVWYIFGDAPRTVEIGGTLVCYDKEGIPRNMEHAIIGLYEHDGSGYYGFDAHDLLNATEMKKEGVFHLTGTEKEWSRVQYFIHIEIECENPDGTREPWVKDCADEEFIKKCNEEPEAASNFTVASFSHMFEKYPDGEENPRAKYELHCALGFKQPNQQGPRKEYKGFTCIGGLDPGRVGYEADP